MKDNRLSKQREGIKNLLNRENYHPDADEIYFEMKKICPGIGIATVYRNLEKLSSAGVLEKIVIPGRPAKYDGNTEKHSHVICNVCGRVNDIWLDSFLGECRNSFRTIADFDIGDINLSFHGLCRKCKKF